MSEIMLGQRVETHDKLDVMVGHWCAEDVSDSDRPHEVEQATAAIAGGSEESGSEEIHEWVPDGFFLVHRWDATVGELAFKGTEIVGYEPARGDFFTRFFDQSDGRRECRASADGNMLTFKEPNSRATVALTDEGTSLDIAWEWREDGSDWLPLCDLVSRRAQ
jgi:hypothetical protein